MNHQPPPSTPDRPLPPAYTAGVTGTADSETETATVSAHLSQVESEDFQLIEPVAVLFARPDSIYKTLPGCDVYDVGRDALAWLGGSPVVAHPPCRLWGRLRHFARSDDAEAERAAALWVVGQVRRWGGVLEHPSSSTLWPAAGLPAPGRRDEFGGFTLAVSQWWWGHKADKLTWLYVCGIELADLPPVPFKLGEPEYVVQSRNGKTIGRTSRRQSVSIRPGTLPCGCSKWRGGPPPPPPERTGD
jgi:hypothetical protein